MSEKTPATTSAPEPTEKRKTLQSANSMNQMTSQLSGKNTLKEFSQTFDYVIVFPMEEGGNLTPAAKYVCKELLAAGFEIFPYLSVQDDELIVMFRIPVSVLPSRYEGLKKSLTFLCISYFRFLSWPNSQIRSIIN